MSDQADAGLTLFVHSDGEEHSVLVRRDGEDLLRGRLEIKETDAGPRPARFRVADGADEDLRRPREFVATARRVDRIRLSEQTPDAVRHELRELFDGYQLAHKVATVRTCRRCSEAGRYSPLTAETAVDADDEQVCVACARRELEREADYRGLEEGARRRLEGLLAEVGDVERVSALLSGDLDPELTKVDEIGATADMVEPVPVEALDLHPTVASILAERFETLLPVQSLGVEHGVLEGRDLLVVSATATGKTLVGELPGIDRVLRDRGKLLFLVPYVALANQKHEQFRDRYGDVATVGLRVGTSRIRDDGVRFDPAADVVVGTYEGVDHALRTGRDIGEVGTVVIDEIHTIGEGKRGHRLDGLLARLRHYCRGMDTQWIYLSATVGNPAALARALDADLVEFEERPVPIERHLTFARGPEKTDIEDRLVRRAFDRTSSTGYRGQTIVFTNSRRRCHEISRQLAAESAPYHAGLDYGQRTRVEQRFGEQDLAAVVTTAALSAGVDFPASQVIFDSLAMGIEWLTVQEFEQMLGRAGRPDYHDRGRVYLLVEPDRTYHAGQERTEDEVAFELLDGTMESVRSSYDEQAAVEETLANVVVAGEDAPALNEMMVGEVPTRHALAKLIDHGFIDGLEPTAVGRVVAEHFLAPGQAFRLLEGIRRGEDPDDLVAAMALRGEEE